MVNERHAAGGAATRHVVVIDANTLLVSLYRALFDTIGCTVVHAPHVDDALRLLHDAAQPAIDLVILDDGTVAGCDAVRASTLRSRLAERAAPQISTVCAALGPADPAEVGDGRVTRVSKPVELAAFSDLALRCMAWQGRAEPAPRTRA
jgi:DNA-binding NtrC family response regulator